MAIGYNQPTLECPRGRDPWRCGGAEPCRGGGPAGGMGRRGPARPSAPSSPAANRPAAATATADSAIAPSPTTAAAAAMAVKSAPRGLRLLEPSPGCGPDGSGAGCGTDGDATDGGGASSRSALAGATEQARLGCGGLCVRRCAAGCPCRTLSAETSSSVVPPSKNAENRS